MMLVDLYVEAAQEFDGVQVFAAAICVRNPLSLLTGIVEIQHRCDCIDAQPVDVISIQPKHRAAQEKAAHLMAAVVEGETIPISVNTLTRVGVLVKVGAVEIPKTPVVCREVRRNPVEDDGDSVLV